ncbi:hypothetical protein AVEN_253586-1 [Araneus ventricosus]|uniref:Uncharacterized protein n=1 Tax=Araneus ventricosus TaxID=182803 RepID=A0A4Y2CBD9_ARAVE|nr:hypothetical protein AVEN_253586-1 [Araneus ventricosus]
MIAYEKGSNASNNRKSYNEATRRRKVKWFEEDSKAQKHFLEPLGIASSFYYYLLVYLSRSRRPFVSRIVDNGERISLSITNIYRAERHEYRYEACPSDLHRAIMGPELWPPCGSLHWWVDIGCNNSLLRCS